jgi:hypothetical protein
MGSLGAAAGFPIPGQQGGVGQVAAGGAKDQAKGATGPGGAPLGIQRPGYGGGGQGGSQNRTVLTMEDLGMAVGESGGGEVLGSYFRGVLCSAYINLEFGIGSRFGVELLSYQKPYGITLALEIIRKINFCANVSRLFYLQGSRGPLLIHVCSYNASSR